MTPTELLPILARMEDCQRAAKFLLGDKYEARMAEIVAILEEHAAECNVSLLSAATTLADRVKDDAPGLSVQILAAAYEWSGR